MVKNAKKQQVCGFLFGTLNTAGFYRDFLLKKSFSAALYLFPKLLSVRKVRKVFETMFYPSKKEMQILPKAELLDIALLKKYQGRGLAQNLFREFSSSLYEVGIEEFKITIGEDLLQAQRFYEKLGATKSGTIEVHKGQKTLVYIYKMPKMEKIG